MRMNIRQKVEDKISKKVAEIREYEMKIAEARAYIEGLKSSLQMLPKETLDSYAGRGIREGSNIFKVQEILRKEGKPLHITDLLMRLGKEVTTKNKRNLTGSLGSYVRNDVIFCRTKPSTFGLIEFKDKNEASDSDEPDENFL